MGVVYLASRKSESVALKVVRDSLLDDEVEAARFTREISTLEKIRSPYVARILETGVDDGRAWFAVEFVNGPNLSELVQDKGPLDEDRWWELARGLLRGLADVHATGVLHRDVKPANVIMAEGGPKLIDFGIAHVSDATSVTATGLVAGSPAWFSPEQIEGLELTSATDVFSAGSVLTYAATGSSPWGGETAMTKASVFKILTSEPDVSGLSQAQASLVSAMLEKEVIDRPTADSLLEHLESLRNGEEAKLKTGGLVPVEATADDTTVVKRSNLTTAPRPIPVTTPGFAPNTAQTAVMPTSQKRRNLLAAVAITVIAVVGISVVVANSSGSGKIQVLTSVDSRNKAIGDYSLRLSSSSIEPVTLDLSAKDDFGSVFTWKTGEPIRLSYSPPFSEDEAYEGTITPSDLGLGGFNKGQVVNLHVKFEKTSTLLSFRAGGNSPANEVYAIRLARGNETQATEICVKETQSIIKTEASRYTRLSAAYNTSAEKANLEWFAEEGRNLLFTTWAYRSGQLVKFMEADLRSAESASTLMSAAQEYANQIVSAHSALTQAWLDLRDASQRESQSAFSEANTAIYAAENRLKSAVARSPKSYSVSECSTSVN
jgi:serine/threonine protein kinase